MNKGGVIMIFLAGFVTGVLSIIFMLAVIACALNNDD